MMERVDVAYVLIVSEDARSILMVQNDNGVWTMPGGMREPGETLAEAAVREAREETGFDVRLGPVVQISERLYETHDLFVTFRAEVVAGTLGAGILEDVQTVVWKTLDEAQALMPVIENLRGLVTAGAPYQSRRGK